MFFSSTKDWLARWTWSKVWKLIVPILLELLKDQLTELKEIAKKDTDTAVNEIKAKIDEKL